VSGVSRRTALLAALFIAGVGLRPQLIVVGPLLPRLEAEFGFSHFVGGMLTSIPLVCMGLFALLTPAIVRRFGTSTTVSACLVGLAAGGLLRAFSPSTIALLALTVPIGVAIGVAGTAIPVFVKEHFAARFAFATGMYVTAIQLGSTIGAAVAVPLAIALGGWRDAVAVTSVALVASWLGWRMLTRPAARMAPAADAGVSSARAGGGGDEESAAIPVGEVAATPRLDWTDPMGWWLAAIFWLSALPFYGLSSWLAAAYVEHGWSEVDAGNLVAVVGLSGLPVTLVAAWAADRIGSRRLYLTAFSLVSIVAGAGLVVAPAFAFVWAIAAGGSLGALFTLSMTLPLDVNADPSRTSGTVAMMLCVGYLLTALTPIGLGAIRDLTGSFTLSLWVNVLAVVVLLVISQPLSPARLAAARSRSVGRVQPSARPGSIGA
jgi:CP family cyanate transporter-like MFS transporter